MKKKSQIIFVSGILACTLVLSGCKDKYGMVKIKGGAFTEVQTKQIEGLKVADVDLLEQEKNPKTFSLGVSDFYISKYEVTQQLYDSVMSKDAESNSKPSYFDESPAGNEKQELRPVERVTWYDCLLFCNRLSKQEGLDPVYTIDDISRYKNGRGINKATVTADYSKNGYRLPTRAEWIYAASGGTKSKNKNNYSGSANLDEIAWHENNADEMTHQVGLKKPNELGLYDMNGNVAEWCWDCLWTETLSCDAVSDYKGPSSGRYRYILGGTFVKNYSGIEFYYDIYRELGGIQGSRYQTIGFRIARNVK